MPWTRAEIDECEKRLASIAAALEECDSVTVEARDSAPTVWSPWCAELAVP